MIKIFQFLSLVLLFLFSDSQTLLLAKIDGCEKHWIWDGFCDSGFFFRASEKQSVTERFLRQRE